MTDDNEKIEKVIQESEEYAKKNGFRLNPNRKIVGGDSEKFIRKRKEVRGSILPLSENFWQS